MQDLVQSAALVFVGMALGWTAMFSFIAAPQAYRDLDHGRASRFVRTAMRTGHPAVAGFAAIGALCAGLAQAFGGAAVLAMAALIYLLARVALIPEEKKSPTVRRRLRTGRVLASALTAMTMIALIAAAGMVAIRV